MTLYELTDQYLELLNMMDDPSVDPDVLEGTLESLGGDIEDKADNYAKVARTLEAQVASIKAEEERLKTRRETILKNLRHLKESLQNAMVMTGKTKFKTDLFSFNIQKNPATLKIDDASKVPEKYLVYQDPRPDAMAIKADIKAGAVFDWCHMEQTSSLRIR